MGAAALAGLAIVGTSIPAAADPSGPDTPYSGRTLQGVGSDLTEGVMSDLADVVTLGGTKQIASWDATGSGDFQTRASAACTYTRAETNGSNFGRQRLLESLDTGDARSGCLDFARSSTARGTTVTSPSLTWIPFARELSSYAVRSDGTSPRSLTLAQVRDAYKCLYPADPANGDPGIIPVLPPLPSAARTFWLQSVVGITELAATDGTYPCLTGAGTATSRAYAAVNDARSLQTDEIMPFSVGAYTIQTSGLESDFRGLAVIAQIDGSIPMAATTTFPVGRELFNVVPTSKLLSIPTNPVFVGPTSQVCSHPGILTANGFVPITNCGDVSSQS